MSILLIKSAAGDGRTSAMFEDDGTVAYCYILVDGAIVSDVWVYNRKRAPIARPWEEGRSPPYSNPAEYAFEPDLLPSSPSDVSIEWTNKGGDRPVALVRVCGKVFAIVSEGTKPGQARLARKDGPLAKRLPDGCA